MNYRHAYHAGNFADCFKHALYLRLIRAMQRKAKPYLAIDTHAGIGRYDLAGAEAEKTGEWRYGIAKLQQAAPEALAEYLACIESLGLYPGSPAILQSTLREDDRLIACELHPEDAQTLKAEFAGDKRIAVHQRDGYAALTAFLPPPQKRALILIDPPFEQPDEFTAAAKTLESAWKKFNSGVYAMWYPIKSRAPVRNFFELLKLTPIRDVINLEFLLRAPLNPAQLNGCGLLIINPPYGFEAEVLPILQAVQDILGEGDASTAIERLIVE